MKTSSNAGTERESFEGQKRAITTEFVAESRQGTDGWTKKWNEGGWRLGECGGRVRLESGWAEGKGRIGTKGERGKNAIESGWTNCTIKFY